MLSCPLHTGTHVLSNAKFACHCLERACLLISEIVRQRRYAYLRRLYFVVTFVFKSVSVSTSPLISTLKSISLRSCPLGQTLRRCRMFSLQPKSPLRTNSVFPSTMVFVPRKVFVPCFKSVWLSARTAIAYWLPRTNELLNNGVVSVVVWATSGECKGYACEHGA